MGDEHRDSVAVGFFDGIHIGHRELLRLADAAITFRNHPLTVLAPERAPKLLMPTDIRIDKISRFVSTGKVLALDFTPELAKMPAVEFAKRVFFPPSHPSGLKVVCGEDWHFGVGGEGDVTLLRDLGLEVLVSPDQTYAGKRISSTRIREALAKGKTMMAREMLGHNYAVVGQLVPGKGVGSEIGFPTFNIEVGDLPLMLGVYSAKLFGCRAIANYGYSPTSGEQAWTHPVLEVHILRQHPDHNWRFEDFKTEVSFRQFIREERKFDSFEELSAQITKDIKAASVVEWQTRGI